MQERKPYEERWEEDAKGRKGKKALKNRKPREIGKKRNTGTRRKGEEGKPKWEKKRKFIEGIDNTVPVPDLGKNAKREGKERSRRG